MAFRGAAGVPGDMLGSVRDVAVAADSVQRVLAVAAAVAADFCGSPSSEGGGCHRCVSDGLAGIPPKFRYDCQSSEAASAASC